MRADVIRIVVEDDGIGYDEQELSDSGNLGEHIGLRIMSERAAQLGAELRCEFEPGEVSRVTLEFAYPQNLWQTESADISQRIER